MQKQNSNNDVTCKSSDELLIYAKYHGDNVNTDMDSL